MGLFGGDSIIGLDIGTHSIKAVEAAATKGGWQIVRAAVVPTPRGSVADGVINDAQALMPSFRQLFARDGVRSSLVIGAINYTAAVTVRRLPVPVMAPAALRKLVQSQPEHFGMTGGADSIIDFQILGSHGHGEGEQMDALLVCAPRSMVQDRANILDAAGFDTLAVDIEPFALMRSLMECKPCAQERPGATAILDMGAVHTDVTVVHGPHYIFTRSIPFGGEGFTEIIRQAFLCSPEQAEELKTQVDLRWLLSPPEESANPSAMKATQDIKGVLDDLLKEVRNSILYYHAQLPEEDADGMVDTLLLAGGTSLMTGMPEYMEAAFQLRVDRADFSQGFAYPISPSDADLAPANGPIFALALGLAAKEPTDRATAQGQPARGKRQGKRTPSNADIEGLEAFAGNGR